LGSPAEDAFLGAVERGGRHLNALVAFDAVELLLVARSIMDQGFVEPFAPFDGRMIADDMVLLSFQNVDERGWRWRVHVRSLILVLRDFV
jgi:hypothetical protein